MLRRPALVLLLVLLPAAGTSLAAGADAPALPSAIGAPFFPCPPLPDSAAVYLDDASVATDGWGFLVVSSFRAQPLDANGRPSGAARLLRLGTLDDGMSSTERTEVEWGGDRYVATITSWSKDYLFTITRAGDVIAEPELLALTQTRLAFNGSTGMLLGRAIVNGTPAIYAAPVTSEGAVGELTLLVNNSALGTLDVAPLDDGFIAVIALDSGALLAQRLDASGTPLGTPQPLAEASSPQPLRAVSGPAGTLVIWREAAGDQASFKTLAIRPDGTVGAVHSVLDRPSWYPQVVATETGYLLVSARQDAGTLQNEPLALPLDVEGRALGAARALPGMPEAVAPGTGGRVLVVSLVRTPSLLSWISASYLVASDGTPLSQPEPIVIEQAPQREVRAASDGDAFMLAWITTTAAGERIDTSALSTQSEERTCRTARASMGLIQGLALAGSPEGYLLVWGEANAIRASILQGGTWNELPTGLSLERRNELDADLAWDGDAFVLVWVNDRALRAARIAPSGMVSDLGVIATGIFYTPRVAVLPSGALIAVRTEASYPRYDNLSSSGATVFALGRSGSVIAREIEPVRPPTLSELVPDIDVDIAAAGTGAMLAMRDAHEVWAIALGSDGTPLRRTRIAGGTDVSNVAIAGVPGGFAISWIADDVRPELVGQPQHDPVFTAFVDHDGALAGPFRSSDGSIRDFDFPRRGLLDVAARGFEILAGWHGRVWQPSYPINTATRAAAALLSSAPLHPGGLPPPGSPSLRVIGLDRVEIRWAPVPGATWVKVEAKNRRSQLWWWGYSFDPMAGSAVIDGPYGEFRIATVREGLVSEWIELRPTRRRTVERSGDARGFVVPDPDGGRAPR